MRREMVDLTAVMSAFDEEDQRPGTASGLTFSGLRQRQAELEESFRLLERRELDVVLDGAPVLNDAVRVDFLSRLLGALQESISSIGQARLGTATSRGLIERSVRDSTLLRLSGTFRARLA